MKKKYKPKNIHISKFPEGRFCYSNIPDFSLESFELFNFAVIVITWQAKSIVPNTCYLNNKKRRKWSHFITIRVRKTGNQDTNQQSKPV